MIYKILFVFLILFFNSGFSAEFGKYRYSGYIGLQQQLNAQKMNAQRMNRRYYQNPTRNIRYPSSSNPYPNIERKQNAINPNYRYSANYYKNNY